MATRFKARCRNQWCRKIITQPGYCESCAIAGMEWKQKETHHIKDPFYDSALWLKVRKAKLLQDPICEYCRGARATLVDHAQRIKTGGARLDMANLKSSCDRCHNRKRQQESQEKSSIKTRKFNY